MSVTKRLLSSTKIDDYVPTSEVCIACAVAVDKATSHYGRIVEGWINTFKSSILHLVTPANTILQVPTVEEKYFPKKVTGRVCNSCFDTLYNTTWRDKKGKLRRAVEVLHPKVEQPKNDDFEASPITKGLYAPHGRSGSIKSAIVDSTRESLLKEKLEGFSKFRRSNGGPVKHIVRRGKVIE